MGNQCKFATFTINDSFAGCGPHEPTHNDTNQYLHAQTLQQTLQQTPKMKLYLLASIAVFSAAYAAASDTATDSANTASSVSAKVKPVSVKSRFGGLHSLKSMLSRKEKPASPPIGQEDASDTVAKVTNIPLTTDPTQHQLNLLTIKSALTELDGLPEQQREKVHQLMKRKTEALIHHYNNRPDQSTAAVWRAVSTKDKVLQETPRNPQILQAKRHRMAAQVQDEKNLAGATDLQPQKSPTIGLSEDDDKFIEALVRHQMQTPEGMDLHAILNDGFGEIEETGASDSWLDAILREGEERMAAIELEQQNPAMHAQSQGSQ
jgi:hypothetical protein